MSLKLRVQAESKLIQLDVSPSSLICEVVRDACKQIEASYDPLNFHFLYQKKEVDSSLPFKNANIPSNSIVELKYRVLAKNLSVKVALQPPSGQRMTDSFNILSTFWDLLKHWEKKQNLNFTKTKGANPSNKKQEGYMQPTIQLNNLEIASNEKLATTRLADVGLRSGSILIRLTFKFDPDLSKLEFDPSQVIQKNNNTESLSNSQTLSQQELETNKKKEEEENKRKLEFEKQVQLEQEKKKKMQLEVQQQLEQEKKKQLEKQQEEEERKKKFHEQKLQQMKEQQEREQERKKQYQVEQQKLDQLKLIQLEKQKEFEKQKRLLKEKEKQLNLPPQNLNHQKTTISNNNNDSGVSLSQPKIEEKKVAVERNRCIFAPSDKPPNVNDIQIIQDFEEEEPKVSESEFKEFSSIAPGENWLFKGKENEIMTKKKREEMKSRPYQKYKKTNIRVRFPDRFELQGTFDKNEGTKDLIKFVSENLAHPEKSFYLYTTPPKINLPPNESFVQQRLVPAAIVYFSYSDSKESSSQYLKSELLSNVLPTSTNLVSTFEKLSTEDQLKNYKSDYLSKFDSYGGEDENNGKQEIEEKKEKKENKGVDLFSKLRNKK